MSKIAEQKALEAYPMNEYEFDKAKKSNIERKRFAYIKGYDQAMQDMVKDSDYLKYLSDEVGYGYACGCRKTMKDFLEKSCEYLYQRQVIDLEVPNIDKFINDFKNYIENE